MTASVWKVMVTVGQTVAEDDELLILESMKMEIPVAAPTAGTVRTVHVAPSDQVTEGQVLITIE